MKEMELLVTTEGGGFVSTNWVGHKKAFVSLDRHARLHNIDKKDVKIVCITTSGRVFGTRPIGPQRAARNRCR